MKRCEAVADHLNSNPRFRLLFTGRSIAERFKTRMYSFIQMRNVDEAASGVAYEFTETGKLPEDIKSQIYAAEEMRTANQNKQTEQQLRKETDARLVLCNSTGKRQRDEDDDNESENNVSHGPNRQRYNESFMDTDTGLEEFGESIEKREQARLALEKQRLELQAKVHADLLAERENERSERREAEQRLERRKPNACNKSWI